MTFSLVARCSKTGMFGLAISSSSPAVAARCAFARAGIGAVASQNVTDPRLGPLTLDLMAQGQTAETAVTEALDRSNFTDYRQVLAVDSAGRTTVHSGSESLGVWSHAQAENVASGGNLLAKDTIPRSIVETFVGSSGHLGDRLITALRAGLDAGGEAGPVHSAGMMIVDHVSWPVVDLRCDWTQDCPITTLATAWDIYKPQLEAYIARALDPRQAPSYGVPGDQ